MQKYKPINASDETHWVILHVKNALNRACLGDILHFMFIEKCLKNQPNLYHVHMLTNKQKEKKVYIYTHTCIIIRKTSCLLGDILYFIFVKRCLYS